MWCTPLFIFMADNKIAPVLAVYVNHINTPEYMYMEHFRAYMDLKNQSTTNTG